MQYRQILEMSEEERMKLRKVCHMRVASAARNSDPPSIEDLLTLDWLDKIADGSADGDLDEKDVSPPDQY